jgi:alpha-D-xyloside xylohydrolase
MIDSFRHRTPPAILLLALSSAALAQLPASPVIERNGQSISIQPYAPNIVRVTLSTIPTEASAAPGPGFLARPIEAGWSHTIAQDGSDLYSSDRMIVKVAASRKRDPNAKPPDTAQFFSGSVPGVGIEFTRPDGSPITAMDGWQMATLNQKDDTLKNARGILPADLPLYTVGASFRAPDDEHYYGLGQNQEGYLDHRQRPSTCAANYLAPASPSWCVPFLVTNKGYGILWDNPSSTTIEPAFDGKTRWTSTLGRRVSYFVIVGRTTDEIYSGYRLLTGPTPMLPKAAYGFIQSKQRYSSQAEILAVAKGYRDRHLPLDIIVVDWFYYTKMGQYDFKPNDWPDPTAMNKQLHDQNIESMISVWPRFTPESRYYDQLLKRGWFEHYANTAATPDNPGQNKPVDGLPYDKAGSDIDTTNPKAARWWWQLIHDNISSKGFDYFWADETEPDLPPDGAYLHIGPGAQYLNVYPLFHTAAIYDGVRRDGVRPDEKGRRALTLARDAYTGAQRNGTIFWTSDVSPTWDTLRRQIPTGLNNAASGIAYTGNDIGGWQSLQNQHTPAHPPLLSADGARDNVHQNEDYPELYTRWFEYGTFLPTMRTHGTRNSNEVWSYGPQAQPILEKYLKLRYALMPYLYSLGWFTHQTGAPFMRALFMDFPADAKVFDDRVSTTEYMFGPALLVAPVTEQGATTREVYLPAGYDWYNYWTNERFHGGRTITVQAPIDTIPLFVKAGSILPLGAPVESTHDKQAIQSIKVYPGADANFTLYNDDGLTYAYENGETQITILKWNDKTRQLTHTGAKAWDVADRALVVIIGSKNSFRSGQ